MVILLLCNSTNNTDVCHFSIFASAHHPYNVQYPFSEIMNNDHFEESLEIIDVFTFS